MKKFLFSTLALVTFIQMVSAQEPWQNYYRSDKIEINFTSEECNANGISKKILVLQFVNLTSDKLLVRYNKKMWYNGKCVGCETSPEQSFSVTLNPNESVVGSCANKSDKTLYIVDRMLNVQSSMLTKFELADISVVAAR